MKVSEISGFNDVNVRLRQAFLGGENDALRTQFFSSQTLAHYTTAENALNILKGEVWLRNTRVMNDVAEIQYGASLIEKSLQSGTETDVEPALKRIGAILDQAHPNIAEEVFEDFRSKLWNLVHRTHVTCLSVRHQRP